MAKGGFRGGYGGMGGMSQANMMKQAQKMQQELAKMQAELEASNLHPPRRAAALSRPPSAASVS